MMQGRLIDRGEIVVERLRIAVCDDEAFALEIIREAIGKVLQQKKIQGEIKTFRNVRDLQKKMQETSFDLLLLDIDMPVIDGIEFGKKIRQQKEKADIIYVSSREDRVFDSLRVNPYGFIRKNHFLEDIPQVLGTYLEQRQEKADKKIVLQLKDRTETVSIDAIYYVEGARKYQQIYVAGKTIPIEVRKQMQELEEEFKEFGFIRIHKGYLVNYKHIQIFKENEVILDDWTSLPMSRRKAAEVKDYYMELMKNEGSIVF